MGWLALVRPISSAILHCELTHVSRVPIDFVRAQQQHEGYIAVLEALGAKVHRLGDAESFADGAFVEDPAFVLPEVAVITRLGAASRQAESASVAAALKPFRKLEYIRAPGTLEGGDVWVIGKTVFVGLSTRTNEDGFAQLRKLISPFGYELVTVPVKKCLHLKTAVSFLGRNTVLLNSQWVEQKYFKNYDLLFTDAEESFGANSLRLGEALIYSSAFPKTGKILRDAGFKYSQVDNSELLKAESGLSCLSLIFPA